MRVWANTAARLATAASLLLMITYALLTSYQRSRSDDEQRSSALRSQGDAVPLWEQHLDFASLGFSNETGNPSGCYVVPNYIHFVRFGDKPVSFVEFICILAAFKNQNPEKIFFHYDDPNTFSGKYWEILQSMEDFWEVVVMNEVVAPDLIFGQPLSRAWKKWHGSDIMRIRMVMKYGGIFLDNDCYLIKSVNRFRKFEISINWDQGQFMGSQVIVAHKDARFLQRWLDCYRVYNASKWYYNAGEKPTVEVLYREPELVHRVKVLFGADTGLAGKLYRQNWPGWRDMYVFHLLARHQYIVKSISEKAKYPVVFSEDNIGYYPTTFREMVYDVYNKANLSWPQNRFDD